MSADIMDEHTKYLKLGYVRANHAEMASEAARKHWSHADYLQRLLDGEVASRQQRALERRISLARFPVKKTFDQYQWDWPKKINEQQVRHLFRLGFVQSKTNVVFVGGVGLGKTHLASALGYAACQAGHTVLFTTAVDAVNNLVAAQAAQKLKTEMARYVTPSVLVLDEIGYLPLDKAGADLLFQIISKRYEQGSIVLTTNKAYKQWPSIFNNDAGITSAILDRLLHQAETVIIEGKSYRMKNRVEDPPI
ncbi:MAG TPA: IS21-like element helper ATPase IstB [Bryobacteraceae bacterium]|nr:IS21-like element helper ATPase IstB [Bryobacteraceae bacterium]